MFTIEIGVTLDSNPFITTSGTFDVYVYDPCVTDGYKGEGVGEPDDIEIYSWDISAHTYTLTQTPTTLSVKNAFYPEPDWCPLVYSKVSSSNDAIVDSVI